MVIWMFIIVSKHPEILGVMWPADPRAIFADLQLWRQNWDKVEGVFKL